MRETASFEQFFRKNYEHFFFFALRFLGSEEDSRDIVDDAMEYVWVNYQDSSVDNWFRYTISFIRNKCIDKLRHDMVRRRYADFYKYVEEHKEEMSFEEDDERITLIEEAIALLPERTRYVLTECYVNKKVQGDRQCLGYL